MFWILRGSMRATTSAAGYAGKAAVAGVLAAIVASTMYTSSGFVHVRSAVDGRTYRVLKKPDSQQASDALARLCNSLGQLCIHMLAKYPRSRGAMRLYDRFNPASVSEGAYDTQHTSFSINKGEKIVFCIRHSDGSLVDPNTLMYVAIHELAHVMTREVGHGKAFWRNMQWLVREAADRGLYRVVDYTGSPARYCGIKINSSVA